MAVKTEAQLAAENWSPLTKEEVQAERADQLLMELKMMRARLNDHESEYEEKRGRLEEEIDSGRMLLGLLTGVAY